MAIVHRPLGALASMIVPLEAPLLDPELAPLDVAPEPLPDPLDAPLPVPELAPLPDPDDDPELELAPPLLLADPEEPPSSDAAPWPELLPHPAPAAQPKAASESDAMKVDRRMKILRQPWEARSARDRLESLFEGCQPAPLLSCDVRARGACCPAARAVADSMLAAAKC
jgi:hypothetical protein